MLHGSCLCGAVEFEITGPARDVVACHCSQCRSVSGHYWGASSAPLSAIRLIRDGGLRWHQSSAEARRGFCAVCGSTLFWEPAGEARWSVSPGAIDGPSGLATVKHIFTDDAGDYYAPDAPPPMGQTHPDRLAAACLCGAASFTLPGPAGEVIACHCTQCRKTSGYYSASFDADETAVEWQGRDTVREYETRGGGQRGFCAACGSSLYFRSADGDFSVEAGTVRGPTGGQLAAHIFVADKGDYYTLDDGLPQFPGWG